MSQSKEKLARAATEDLLRQLELDRAFWDTRSTIPWKILGFLFPRWKFRQDSRARAAFERRKRLFAKHSADTASGHLRGVRTASREDLFLLKDAQRVLAECSAALPETNPSKTKGE